jgi:signal transduction histidine kinase
LAICQRIVTMHGGKISISSKLGEGTVCIVHLPVSRWTSSPTQQPEA